MNATAHLHLATRMHFALLRHYGQKVEIGELMKADGEVREAIWVCEASGDPELAAMAQDLRRANEAPGRVPQDTAWAGDTTGFGMLNPLELEADSASADDSSWFRPSSWLRLGITTRER